MQLVQALLTEVGLYLELLVWPDDLELTLAADGVRAVTDLDTLQPSELDRWELEGGRNPAATVTAALAAALTDALAAALAIALAAALAAAGVS